MSLVINHNMMAMNAARNLGEIYDRLSTSTRRLSSGLRVGTAADDAAGLAIREMMRTEIATINQGIRNASDAISMIQTAEGAMSVIDEKLTRMKELAEQAATGTYTTAQREIINSEYQAMAAEIDRIANATDFNGVKLLDGSLATSHDGSGMKIHFGTGNSAAEDYYYINTGDVRATFATGLRVGNSDPRDTIRTTGLNGVSQTSPINQGKGLDPTTVTDGYFGIRYTQDFDAEQVGQESWQVYGYIQVDVSRDSINDIVQQINKGAQATGTMNVGAVFADQAEMDLAFLTINGNILRFSTAGEPDESTFSASGATGTIMIGTGGALPGSATELATAISAYMNKFAEEVGVYGAQQGTTLHFFAHEFGINGNDIATHTSSTKMTMNQINLEDGGKKVLTATAFYDVRTNEYELQIQMNVGGEKNQVQTFGFSSIGQTASNATIMGGTINGVLMDTASGTDWMGRMNVYNNTTITDGKLNTLSLLDQLNEWLQPQNGSGTTDWDGADVLTQSNAQRSLAALDEAVLKKDTVRAQLGSIQNRLENTITNLQIQAENLQAAESRISDVDVATEMTEFTRNNIMAQAATAMLAQANSLPQLALQLISG